MTTITLVRAFERVIVATTVPLLVFIGYRLFLAGATGQITIVAQSARLRAKLANLAPGALCFLLGTALAGYLLSSRIPHVDYQVVDANELTQTLNDNRIGQLEAAPVVGSTISDAEGSGESTDRATQGPIAATAETPPDLTKPDTTETPTRRTTKRIEFEWAGGSGAAKPQKREKLSTVLNRTFKEAERCLKLPDPAACLAELQRVVQRVPTREDVEYATALEERARTGDAGAHEQLVHLYNNFATKG